MNADEEAFGTLYLISILLHNLTCAFCSTFANVLISD
jgi:hypothetical protein